MFENIVNDNSFEEDRENHDLYSNEQEQKNSSLNNQNKNIIQQASASNPLFIDSAKREMAQVLEVQFKTDPHYRAILSTNQNTPVKAGFTAEIFHAETFNYDSILKGSGTRAYTDRDSLWGQLEVNGRPLKINDLSDIIIRDSNGNVIHTIQSKYCKNAESTARELSQVNSPEKNGQAKYDGMTSLLAPDDQVSGKDGITTVKEHAQAKADALRKTNGDEAHIKAYENTAEKTTNVISDGKSSSQPLTKQEAETIAQNDTRKIETIRDQYKTQSTVKQMGNAAVNAAAMSTIISGTVNTVEYINQAKEGKITTEQAVEKILIETVCSAADSAVKASANVGVHSLIVRYGGEKMAMQALAKQGLASACRANLLTAGVICTIDSIKDLVKLGTGEISKEIFYERQGKNFLNTTAGIFGGSLGVASSTGAVGLFTTNTLALTATGLLGGLSGGIIAGLAMSMAVENGIEKPYRDLVESAQSIHNSAHELQKLSEKMCVGQVFLEKCLLEIQNLDTQIDMYSDFTEQTIQKTHATLTRIDQQLEQNKGVLEQVKKSIFKKDENFEQALQNLHSQNEKTRKELLDFISQGDRERIEDLQKRAEKNRKKSTDLLHFIKNMNIQGVNETPASLFEQLMSSHDDLNKEMQEKSIENQEAFEKTYRDLTQSYNFGREK